MSNAKYLKLVHHDDKKVKSESHEIYLKEEHFYYNPNHGLFSHNLLDVKGYGETKEEALEDFKRKMNYLFKEYKEIEKMLFETDTLTDNIVEVDWSGKEIK